MGIQSDSDPPPPKIIKEMKNMGIPSDSDPPIAPPPPPPTPHTHTHTPFTWLYSGKKNCFKYIVHCYPSNVLPINFCPD